MALCFFLTIVVVCCPKIFNLLVVKANYLIGSRDLLIRKADCCVEKLILIVVKCHVEFTWPSPHTYLYS